MAPAWLLSATAGDATVFGDRNNFFRAGARAGFDVGVQFRNTGGGVRHQAGPGTGGGLDRTYLDGFVKVDASGNAGGETWFWGYRNDSQVVQGGTAIGFSALEGNPYGGSSDADSDPQWGAEIGYTRILGQCLGGRWGLDLALDWTDFQVTGNGTTAGSLTALQDLYSLGGILVPTAPYAGSSNGPGPVIADTPTRTAGPLPTVVDGRREVSGSLYTFKFGPTLEVPLGDRFSAQLSAGLAVGLFDADFEFSESAIAAGTGTWVRSGRTDSQDWLLGGFARGQLTVRLTDSIGLYGAAEFQGLEGTRLQAGGREAAIDLDSTFQFSAGLVFRF
jgi:hypothetical protein